MKADSHGRRYASVLRSRAALLVLMLLAGPAYAQRSVEWDRFEVETHLDNDGAVSVTETLTATITGGEITLERLFADSSGHQVVMRSLAAEEDGGWRPITDYTFWHGTLEWRALPEGAPAVTEETLRYRLEYELRGALMPAWDIPAGPDEFLSRETFRHLGTRTREILSAWRGPRSRYRFDHDVLFARFAEEGPRRLDYTFRYDTAWRHPQPDAPLMARVKPDVNYRVTEWRDYLQEGPPPAVAMWKPRVRIGSLVAFAVAMPLMWLLFAASEVRRRGWGGPRLDREWFRKRIGGLKAEVLASRAGTFPVCGVPLLLARWSRKGVIAFHEMPSANPEDDPVLQWRRLSGSGAIEACERKFLDRLFSGKDTITSTEFAALHAKNGFDPFKELEIDLFEGESDKDDARPLPKQPLPWRLLGLSMTPIFLLSAVFILIESFRSDYNDSISPAMYLAGGAGLVALLCRLAPQPLGGLGRAMLALPPLGAAALGLAAAHLQHNLPLLPEGSLGMALLALGCGLVWLLLYRSVDEFATEEERDVVWAKRMIRRELRKARPQMEDQWMPQILALGLGPQVEKWRAQQASRQKTPRAMPERDAGRVMDMAPPFTGAFSLAREFEWATMLQVDSEADLRRFEVE